MSIIKERLTKTGRVIAISSGKDGVGKSMVASALALGLVRRGFRVGLFDVDFTGPSTHIILGVARDVQPVEDRGLVPAEVEGLRYMSLVYFIGDRPAPLRGGEVSNALIELLSVTQWGPLDFLIVDMPPGIGDAVLDLVRLVKKIEFLIITTPSLLAFEVVKKQTVLLGELGIPIIGVVENMKQDNRSHVIESQTEKLGLRYLCGVAFDPKVESVIGHPARLLDTALGEIIEKLERFLAAKKGNADGLQGSDF